MGNETVLFKSEEKKTNREIASVLRQIADKVEMGVMTLGQNDNKITLDFPQNMALEIKVEEEVKGKTKRSLEIELEWLIGGQEEGSLVID